MTVADSPTGVYRASSKRRYYVAGVLAPAYLGQPSPIIGDRKFSQFTFDSSRCRSDIKKRALDCTEVCGRLVAWRPSLLVLQRSRFYVSAVAQRQVSPTAPCT